MVTSIEEAEKLLTWAGQRKKVGEQQCGSLMAKTPTTREVPYLLLILRLL